MTIPSAYLLADAEPRLCEKPKDHTHAKPGRGTGVADYGTNNLASFTFIAATVDDASGCPIGIAVKVENTASRPTPQTKEARRPGSRLRQ